MFDTLASTAPMAEKLAASAFALFAAAGINTINPHGTAAGSATFHGSLRFPDCFPAHGGTNFKTV